jgi:uncharacterized protein (TIGR02118 family)
MDREKVVAVVAEPPDPRTLAMVERATVHDPHPSEPPGSPFVLCLWFGARAEATWPRLGLEGQAYLVAERVQWELDPHPPVIRFSFLNRHTTLTRDEFSRHWDEVHTPLARRHHPCLIRYVQNTVLARLTPNAPDIDGIAELGAARVEDYAERMYDSPEGRERVFEDVQSFIDLSAGWRIVTAAKN